MQRQRRKKLDRSTRARVTRAPRDRSFRSVKQQDRNHHRSRGCTSAEDLHRFRERLIREGVLPATQLMPSAPWQIPAAALDTEAVKIGVRAVMERRPTNFNALQDLRTLKLPGF